MEDAILAFEYSKVFASLLDLDIAMDKDKLKTRLWAIKYVDRKAIKDDPRTANVKLEHDARDLGAHMVYCCKRANATVVQRITQALQVLARIETLQNPFDVRYQSFWPQKTSE